jgi:hypothetical protein
MIDTRVRRRDDIEEIARATDPFQSPNNATYQFLNRFPVFYSGVGASANQDSYPHQQQTHRPSDEPRRHQRHRANEAANADHLHQRIGGGDGPGPRFAASRNTDLLMVDSTASTLTGAASSDSAGSSCGTWAAGGATRHNAASDRL